MSYVDNNLLRGESVVHRARVSWWSALPISVFCLLLTVITAGFGLIVAIPVMGAVAMRIYSTELAVTNKRVIAKFGFLRRTTVELKLERVEGLQVNQGIFGRMFNYGSLLVSGTGVTQAPIPGIDRPLEFRRLCLEYAEDAARPANQQTLAPAAAG